MAAVVVRYHRHGMVTSPPSAGGPDHGSRTASLTSMDDETVVGVGSLSSRRSRADQGPLRRGDRVGRYLLIDPLGRGAMGQVYRAYDPDLDRTVAIKLLFETDHLDEGRLLDEARAMARIDHAHVVTVYDVGRHEGTVFIAMEVVDGLPLDRWLETSRSPAEILDVLVGAARGLAAAHAAGVVHRDFKPRNVLVTPSGQAKVLDFGLAGLEEQTGRDTGEEWERGAAMGTPSYMSPEHIAGAGIDARSDQFSFAITLYEALHGVRPFSATTWPTLVAQVLGGEVIPELAGRSGGVGGVIRRALHVDPGQRYSTMEELIAALERARRRPWARWAIAGGLAAALGLGALVWQPRAEERCVPGAEQVAPWWNDAVARELAIDGGDLTEQASAEARGRFAAALDEYAGEWAEAHDETCIAVGPGRERGSAAERSRAQCLDNRLESLRGLVELSTSTGFGVARADALVDTLPSVDDCAEGRWVPYPSEPERAVEAAALHRSLQRIERERLADHGDDLDPRSAEAVARARELGEPYILARALAVRARTIETTDETWPLYDEALEVAVGGGFDLLGATIINELFLTMNRTKTDHWRDMGHLAAMARGLVARGGGDEVLLGNLAVNESNALRHAARYDLALGRLRDAEAHYRRGEQDDGIATTQLNGAIVYLLQDRPEEALPQMRDGVEQITRALGPTAPRTIQARLSLLTTMLRLSRVREAFGPVLELYEEVSEDYTMRSYSLRRVVTLCAVISLDVREVEVGTRMLALLREMPDPADHERIEIANLETGYLQLGGRHEDALARLDELERELADSMSAEDRATAAISRGISLFLLGRHDELHALLAEPWLRGIIVDPEGLLYLRGHLAFLGVLSGAPVPEGLGSWSAVVPEDGTTGGSTLVGWVMEVVEAVDRQADPRPTVRRVRAEMVEAYSPDDTTVRTLDAWLAGPRVPSDSPPPA